MAVKTGMNKFMDFLKLSDPDDDFDDDLFEDEDDDFEDDYVEDKPKKAPRMKAKPSYEEEEDDYDYEPKRPKQRPMRASNPSKLVSINSRSSSNRSSNQVYVIKPQEFNEAQRVTDFLKQGRTIVINMEGIEVHAAQRIIDFIGGSCYALDGSLQAISANIFIAAPANIDVSGDLRGELLSDSSLSPELGIY